jgi:hypothetical protein
MSSHVSHCSSACARLLKSRLFHYCLFFIASRLMALAIAAAQAEWDRVREEKIRGGGGVGGKQDDEEDNGKFVSFVPLPTQAEIESAILAKRKAELLQVRRVPPPLPHCFRVTCRLHSGTHPRSCLKRRLSRLLSQAAASAAGSSNKTCEDTVALADVGRCAAVMSRAGREDASARLLRKV